MIKKLFVSLLMVFIITSSLFSQAQQSSMYCRGGLFPSAYLAMTNIALPNGSGNDYTWISPSQAVTSNGNYNLSFNVSSTTSTAGKYWGDNNATVTVNKAITFLPSSADAHWVIVSGKTYVFTMKDVANATSTTGYIFEFSGKPATIASATNSSPVENAAVTVTATLSGSLVTNQVVYTRWSTSSTFATSTVTQMTGSGTSYTASIPGQAGGTTIYYYCFSSGVTGLTADNCNPATINATPVSNFSIVNTTPAITVTPSTLNNFTYVAGDGGPSLSQSYSISAVLLSGFPGSITVSASSHYEVSADNATFSGTSVSVPYTAATLNSTPVYVRLKAGLPAGSYNSEVIANAGGGISAVNVTCNGVVTLSPLPALSVSPNSLTGFAYIAGLGPSSSKSFSVSGNYLTGAPGNINVKASTDYEVSTDNSTFSTASVNVPFTSGTLSVTPVYVRLKAGLTTAAYSAETVAISGGGATSSVTCNGAVSAPATQILKWTPSLVTESDAVTIIFDATQGTAGLKGYTGDVYAHTGVLTNLSVNSADWKYVKTVWGTNTADTKLTRIGTDLYQLVIGPSIRSYYGVAAAEQILRMSFVFRSSASPYLEGKDVGAADIFITVSAAGLNVLFTTPTTFPIIKNLNEQQQIAVSSANSTNLALYADTTLLAQTATTSLNYTYTCATYGKVWIKAVATSGTSTKVDSFYIIVRPPATVEARPAGVVDGINYLSATSVALSLYAPLKQYAYVIGEFNNWQIDPKYYMKVTSDGHYWVQIDNLSPGTEYGFQYLVDGNLNVADPYADKVLDLAFDKDIPNTVYPDLKAYPTGLTTQIVSVLQTAQTPYTWKATGYTKPPKDNLIIYELFIRDFVSTHSYKTLVDTVSYFKNLGVNAIELMPVNEFDMNDSWGYNPDFMLAVDKYYGTKNDLKAFIDKCHQNGIAVIFDAVLNHQTGNSPLARLWWDAANNQPASNSPYFNVVAPHPYGVYNDLNHESTATKYFVDRVVKYWLSEFKFDGYRFDLSKGFTQTASDAGTVNNLDQSRINNLKRIADVVWSTDSTAYVILEHFCNNDEETILANYNMMLWDKLSDNYASAASGVNADFTWGSYKARGFTKPNAVAFMESHDEERMMYTVLQNGASSGSYNIKTLATAIDRVSLASAFFIPIPGPKMLWQFGELGYDVSLQYNGKAGDKPLHWDYYADATRLKLFKTIKYLNMLKTSIPAFRSTNYTTDLTGTLKKITITDASMNVHIIGNFGLTAQNITTSFPNTGTWYDFFSHTSVNVTSASMSYALQPGEFHVLTSVQLPSPDLMTGIDGTTENKLPVSYALEQNYPNPFNPSTVISYQLPKSSFVTLKVYNVLGKEVATLVSESKDAGAYKVMFNASSLPSGIYFYKLEAGTYTQTRKLMLLK